MKMQLKQKVAKRMTRREIDSYLTSWNVKYPYDRRWREKYKVPLFSSQHRSMCLVDIKLDMYEDEIYSKLRKEYLEEQGKESSQSSLRDKQYIPGYGNWLKPVEDTMTEQEKESLFNKIKF